MRFEVFCLLVYLYAGFLHVSDAKEKHRGRQRHWGAGTEVVCCRNLFCSVATLSDCSLAFRGELGAGGGIS